MNIFDTKSKEISGPINVIRMEGTINGIKKVVYFFMDWHEDITMQTECVNVFSKDLNKYFAEIFYKLNKSKKTYDFFMEIRPTEILPLTNMEVKITNSMRKKKYIYQVLKFFSLVFKYDQEKDIVRISDIFKNVRLHYLDIRDYIKYHVINHLAEANRLSKDIMCHHEINLDQLFDITNALKISKINLDKTIEIFRSNIIQSDKKQKIVKSYQGFDRETVERLVYKIKNTYNHQNIRNILVSYFEKYTNNLAEFSDEISKAIETFYKYGDIIYKNYNRLNKDEETGFFLYGISTHNMRKLIFAVVDYVEYLYYQCVAIFSKITDIYMLRRLLDKDYITNAIIYSGAAHSESYIKILSGHFNFKITHTSFYSVENLNVLNKEIKTNSIKGLDITELILPPVLYQCSNITHFPENFT